MTLPSHIFIVGSYRSGTSLLRNSLNCAGDVWICGETHFFVPPRTIRCLIDYLFKRPGKKKLENELPFTRRRPSLGSWLTFERKGGLTTDKGCEKVVNYIYSNPPNLIWRWIAENIDKELFLRKLKDSDRSFRSFFDLLMTSIAGGKSIRGEKTPLHIYYVPILLEWFPEAKIIHILRDLRAVFVSQKAKKLKQHSSLLRHKVIKQFPLINEIYYGINVTINWMRIVQLHKQYQQIFPDNYYFCQFETLLNNPAEQLKKICSFLNIRYNESMLEQSLQNTYLLQKHQAAGFDKHAVDRWKNHLHPLTNKWLTHWSKKHLIELGYPL
jgi:hypothetical protein